ncbi:hypothetical protein [Kribbella catacumbae]|nr:hypothetical protein [Kribbella catacumbae]
MLYLAIADRAATGTPAATIVFYGLILLAIAAYTQIVRDIKTDLVGS